MFKSLKEKFTSWFKKPETKPEKETEKPKKPEEKPAKAQKIRTSKETKEKKQKKEKSPKKPSKITKKDSKRKAKKSLQEIPEIKSEKPEEKISAPRMQEPTQESTQQFQAQAEQKEKSQQGFFKKLFTRKKELAPQNQEQQIEPLKEQIQEFEKEAESPKEIAEEKPSFFTKLKQKLSTKTLTQEEFDSLFPEFEITLLENNVALEVVDKIKQSLSQDLVGIEVKKSEVESTIINSLKEAILSILQEPPSLITEIKKSLDIYTIIFVGINGSGKTTTIAKLANYLKKHNISSCLAAADTFRAASIEQLKEHASRLNIPIIAHDYGSDPAAVAFDAKKYAKTHNIKVVLIDTAGRMHTKTNLIKEMEKIVRVSKPNLKLFIGESITGNDATEQAKTFNEAINIDGIILSKADVDEKAGTILSVSYITKKPIYFLGTGQSYNDLQPFTKSTVLKNLGLE